MFKSIPLIRESGMATKWDAMFQLHRTPDHDDAHEAAEEYKNSFDGDLCRVVAVEAGADAHNVYVERGYEDGGGWVEIATEPDHDGDYAESMIDTAEQMDAHTRLVFDYTNSRFVLEAWAEPE